MPGSKKLLLKVFHGVAMMAEPLCMPCPSHGPLKCDVAVLQTIIEASSCRMIEPDVCMACTAQCCMCFICVLGFEGRLACRPSCMDICWHSAAHLPCHNRSGTSCTQVASPLHTCPQQQPKKKKPAYSLRKRSCTVFRVRLQQIQHRFYQRSTSPALGLRRFFTKVSCSSPKTPHRTPGMTT